jgi:two-component system, LytTR family, sensor kinase
VKEKNIIYIHLLFWVIIVVSTGLEVIPAVGKYTPGFLAGDYFIYLVSHILIFYSFYFVTGFKRIYTVNTPLIIVSGILVIFIISAPVSYLYTVVLSPDTLNLTGKQFTYSFGRIYFSILQSILLYAVAGALLKLSVRWYENIMKQKEAEKQHLTGELALLRSQINPKFLSNSLSHIKNLVETQPKKAISSIENLSEILSYMLYETSGGKVLLEDEINYLGNYLNLQKERFKPGYIEFEVDGNISQVKVPPLLFLPFLEHVFSTVDDKSPSEGILIKIKTTRDNLNLVINYNSANNNWSNGNDAFIIKSLNKFLNIEFGTNYFLEVKRVNNETLLKLEVKLT